ncbi:hypothetical protein L504_2126 [Bordetella bronchiseptica F2]|nr:hypothetical protein L542_2100 [Bordetella bronchiseptica F-1]KDC29241.1 hypothetical protein L504_2126 [Bordetella bronchiseptica F2]
MLNQARKRMQQRAHKPLAKHAGETMSGKVSIGVAIRKEKLHGR